MVEGTKGVGLGSGVASPGFLGSVSCTQVIALSGVRVRAQALAEARGRSRTLEDARAHERPGRRPELGGAWARRGMAEFSGSRSSRNSAYSRRSVDEHTKQLLLLGREHYQKREFDKAEAALRLSLIHI